MPRTEIVITPTNTTKANLERIADVLDAEGITHTNESGKFYIDEDTCLWSKEAVEEALICMEAGCKCTVTRATAPAEDRSQDWYGRSADTEEWHG